MKDLKILTESFKLQYEKFIIGCDCQEEIENWDKDENGEMDVFYENDMLTILIRLIASDKSVSENEVAFLNESFGFELTAERFAEIYEDCAERLGTDFNESFTTGAKILRSINKKLADEYQELLLLVCDIIANADGVYSEEERAEIGVLKKLFENI